MFQPNKAISVTLTASEWNEVLAQLAEGPFRKVMPLITKITNQAQQQNGSDLTAEEHARVSN